MLSPSQGFCCCLPVRLGALVASLLSFLGSGILAGVTFRSLASISAHITLTQTAGFYIVSVSRASLCFFSFLGFISVIIQHPLILTVFNRFLFYHLPAGILCDLFIIIVLFLSYHHTNTLVQSPECLLPDWKPMCDAFASIERFTWLYLFIIVPAAILQIYVYVIIRRFIFVVSGQWALQQEAIMEQRQRSMSQLYSGQPRSTVTRLGTISGRRRAQAELWFAMETPELDPDDSFLPVMSAKDVKSPPRTPFSRSTTPILSTQPSMSRLVNKTSKSSLLSLSNSVAASKKGKNGPSESSTRRDMDFSDPDPVTPSAESNPTGTHLQQDSSKENWNSSDESSRSEEALPGGTRK